MPRRTLSIYLLWLAIFSVSSTVFLLSAVRSLGETEYTMMVAHSLLHHGTFVLDRNELRLPQQVEMIGNTSKVRRLPLEIVQGRVYKYAPAGTSILSLPFVAAANAFKLSPVDAAGNYDRLRELRMSSILSAVLMATFGVICFETSRLLLPISWSLIVTTVTIFGTQIWSTASRVVEPDSWTVVLLMGALYLLVAHEVGHAKFRPVLLGTLLSWCYFVHPTSAVSIAAITTYVWFYQRKHFLALTMTGAIWFLLLVTYSWHNFGQLLPNYYQATRLGFETFWEALAGNVVSPSRGLLIYVPVLAVVLFTLLRYRRTLMIRPLVMTGAVVLLLHWLVISGFGHWWAGHSYGPRYWTSMVPWFVLLGAAGLNARLRAQRERVGPLSWKGSILFAIGIILAVGSIFIHARGAISEQTAVWNAKPYDIDFREGRLWDWRYPQFLAGLIRPPVPKPEYFRVPLGQQIDFTSDSADHFLWYGWSTPEPQIRWSDEKQAALVFALEDAEDLTLIIKATPFVMGELKDSQRVSIELNSHHVSSLTLRNGTATELSISLPGQFLKRENVLILDFPDAESPANLGLSDDRRLLGIAVQWLMVKPQSPNIGTRTISDE